MEFCVKAAHRQIYMSSWFGFTALWLRWEKIVWWWWWWWRWRFRGGDRGASQVTCGRFQTACLRAGLFISAERRRWRTGSGWRGGTEKAGEQREEACGCRRSR